jgi:hypothetical protein
LLFGLELDSQVITKGDLNARIFEMKVIFPLFELQILDLAIVISAECLQGKSVFCFVPNSYGKSLIPIP